MGLINEVANIKNEISQKTIQQAKKQFYNDLQQKAKNILFDKMIIHLSNNLYYNMLFSDNIKFKIIEATLQDILKLFQYTSKETITNINFYLDNIYYQTAKKAINIYKLKQDAKNYEKMQELNKINIAEAEKILKEANEKQNALNIIDIILTIIFLILLYLLFKL